MVDYNLAAERPMDHQQLEVAAMGAQVRASLGRIGHHFAISVVLIVAACGPGAPPASEAPTAGAPTSGSTVVATLPPTQAPTAVITAPPTQAPTAVITASPSSSAALACTDYLRAAEIATAIGRTASEGIAGPALSVGEVSCNYAFDGGTLSLSIYRGPDAQAYYDGTVASLRNKVQVAGLGRAATYGEGPIGVVKDALAVLDDDVAFTLMGFSQISLGQDALRQLAELVVTRL